MATGPRGISSLVMLTGWDATVLANFALQDGTTFDAVVGDMNTALAASNAELTSDPLWAGLMSFTDQPEVEYRVGSSNGFEIHTEWAVPDSKRASTEGHLLPLIPYDRKLGWSWDYLRQARMPQIQADIADAIKDARDIWRQKILTRLLKRGDDSGAGAGLGSSGYSPGFATTAASTSVDFTPPAVGGTTFDSTHEHYYAAAAGYSNTVFSDAKDELREHGHEPPYEYLISPTDETTVRGLSDFTPVAEGLVRYGTATNVAALNQGADSSGGYYIGTISDFAVRVVRGIPQYYGVGYKSYGARSQRNPLRMRFNKGITVPRMIAMPDPRAGNGAYPLQSLMLFIEFGVGVSDRTAATPRYMNSDTWTDGTAT